MQSRENKRKKVEFAAKRPSWLKNNLILLCVVLRLLAFQKRGNGRVSRVPLLCREQQRARLPACRSGTEREEPGLARQVQSASEGGEPLGRRRRRHRRFLVAIGLFFLSKLVFFVFCPGAPVFCSELAAHAGGPQNAPTDAEARNRHGAPFVFLIDDASDDDVDKLWRRLFVQPHRRRRDPLRRRDAAPDEAGQVQAPRLPSHGTTQ